MTHEEFSNQFDLLLDSYGKQAGFGEGTGRETVFDEYEKSLFLTKAQDEIVTSLYNGMSLTGESFESTEEARRYLSNIIEEARLKPITNTSKTILGIGSRSKFFTLPENLWFITYESASVSDAKCPSNSTINVVPVAQDEYDRIKRNPFRGPTERRALRLDLSDGVVEIVCVYNISSYYIRYIRRPRPIILTELPENLEIRGSNNPSDYNERHSACELHEALHQKILERAVADALQSKLGKIK
jgi:hypothetical protein